MFLTTLIFLDVLVGDANCSQGVLGKLCDHVVKSAFNHIIKGCNLAFVIDVVATDTQHDFGGSLQHHALIITSLAGRVLDDCAHSLAGRAERETNNSTWHGHVLTL